MTKKTIAVIGSGIAGVSAAYYLTKLGFDVSVFEAGPYFGGHTNTIEVHLEGKKIPVDTGFLVHNDRTYPNLIEFFRELNVETFPSEMSFSVVRKKDNLIWAGTNLRTVFAQGKNLFSLKFLKFLREVLRFNKHSLSYLDESRARTELTLGDLLNEKNYSSEFREWYLLPMGGCIWSCPTDEMLKFPAFTFLRFCINHGLLQISDRPQWKTVVNGCRTYVSLALSHVGKKYLNEPVESITAAADGVVVKSFSREEKFDFCFICSHPPETLKMFLNVNADTKSILKNFQYQKNTAVLHTDKSVLPELETAWAAWNYLSVKDKDGNDAVSVTYLINKLQPVPVDIPILVTLNPVTKIDSAKIVKSIEYEHPLFSKEAIKAQEEIKAHQGKQRVYFAGAWMRYGFHEDGILSAKMAVAQLLSDIGSEQKIEIL